MDIRKLAYGTAVSCMIAASFLLSGCSGKKSDDLPVEEAADSVPPMGFWPDSLLMEEGAVRSGETFQGMMTRLGMTSADAVELAGRLDSVFDVRKLRAGNTIRAYYDVDTTASAGAVKTLEYVEYLKNKASSVIFKAQQPVSAWTYDKPVLSERKFAHVTITSSLWNDMRAAGASPLLIVNLSDIYAWSVDFFGLQEGDEFKVMYEQKSCEGTVIAVDTVFYAEFHREDTMIPAIRFDPGDGTGLYWKEDGENLRKAFLKAPLQFSRISSGFSYHRKHPVTGKVRPHTAIDYAAPAGTPVMSIGDGTVISAGWSGGGGNTVKIRHNSSYETAYLHLSRYGKGIKAGTRVRQGQVIGYVGSTGMSTGPHLDFRVWKNGTPVNPLKMDNVPEAPLAKELLPALDSTYHCYKHIMDSLSVVSVVN
ncbi:MAG: peptidoglycan DD-metalloendopeptidase family protein [Bacteroidales bacterium]|nr:peptidoglycan DD-metalloendopeptidase family protein [Bacteroidales bacterium]